MEGKEGVALVIPSSFDAYARVLHPLKDGERWASVAPEYLRRGGDYRYPFPEPVARVEGNVNFELVDALVPVLTEATATPDRGHFGLWNGWGEFHAGGRALLQHSAGSGDGDAGQMASGQAYGQGTATENGTDAYIRGGLRDPTVVGWQEHDPLRRSDQTG